MSEVLLVSKPVAPPWNDSSKNLVRDLALGLRRYEPVVMGRRDGGPSLSRGRVEPLYPTTHGGFAPGVRDNLRVLRRLLAGRRPALWHFFFAPNPKSSAAGRFAARMRRVPTVHTVCSAPHEDAPLERVLFADRTVVLSAHTERRLREAGVDAERVRRIPPGIEPLEPMDDGARRRARQQLELPVDAPLLVYPGDLEFGGGARLVVEAFASLAREDAHLVMACRAKTAEAAQAETELREEVQRRGLEDRTSWIGETPDIHALLGAADLVWLPSASLYAKMDYPLVLLEAMSLGRPVVVATGTPAEELAQEGGAAAVAPEVEALRARTEELLDDDAARERLGEAGRRLVAERYAREPMARAYETLYDELLGS